MNIVFGGAGPSAATRVFQFRYRDLPEVVRAGITAGSLVGVGDVLAQVASASTTSDSLSEDVQTKGHLGLVQFLRSIGSTHWTLPESFDWSRTGRLVFAATAFSGPYWHFGYRFIDKYISAPSQKVSLGKLGAALKKAALTLFVGAPHNPCYFGLLALLEGKSAEDIRNRAKLGRKVWVEGLVLWPFVNVTNFMFISPGIPRIAFGNSIGVVWNIYVSKALALDAARQAKLSNLAPITYSQESLWESSLTSDPIESSEAGLCSNQPSAPNSPHSYPPLRAIVNRPLLAPDPTRNVNRVPQPIPRLQPVVGLPSVVPTARDVHSRSITQPLFHNEEYTVELEAPIVRPGKPSSRTAASITDETDITQTGRSTGTRRGSIALTLESTVPVLTSDPPTVPKSVLRTRRQSSIASQQQTPDTTDSTRPTPSDTPSSRPISFHVVPAPEPPVTFITGAFHVQEPAGLETSSSRPHSIILDGFPSPGTAAEHGGSSRRNSIIEPSTADNSSGANSPSLPRRSSISESSSEDHRPLTRKPSLRSIVDQTADVVDSLGGFGGLTPGWTGSG
ncbi:hypothetical protein M427DRAFT_56086 [Gonapodya prolifera JEL478]|uniref:Uncharacterized protein n=1 Tax=Gonapodya prolifera (strain JEL478) TaxID=1344416 RepID=A0A139AIF9_GONPJ|nr:hypothetical protein M427DRAFT_56086 [Gonapodya prolifera JEL478]|eukprot:KXS16213.1 hypothetical protein M427DRAFT_56086 [Gonapodya prolifera JEL478]